LNFNLFKYKQNLKLAQLPKLVESNKKTNSSESMFDIFLKNELTEPIPLEFDELAPKFITVNKLDFNGTEIHGGIIKDPTSIGGLRYLVIQPRLSVRDKKNFDIIKRLLMIELSVALSDTRSKKDAERLLRKKVFMKE